MIPDNQYDLFKCRYCNNDVLAGMKFCNDICDMRDEAEQYGFELRFGGGYGTHAQARALHHLLPVAQWHDGLRGRRGGH